MKRQMLNLKPPDGLRPMEAYLFRLHIDMLIEEHAGLRAVTRPAVTGVHRLLRMEVHRQVQASMQKEGK